MKTKLLLCLALVLSSGWFAALLSVQAQTNVMPDLSRYTVARKSDWVDTKVKLYRGNGEQVQLNAKASVLAIKLDGHDVLPDGLCIAFVDVPNAKAWIGFADGSLTNGVKDFYVETETDIVGVENLIFMGTIMWQKNSITNTTPALTVDALIDQFDHQTNMQAAVAMAVLAERLKTRVNFSTCFRDWFFYQHVGVSYVSSTPIQQVEVQSNAMRLDFTSSALQIPGSVWIDLKAWKLIKAVEGGKQIYPK